jgi:cell division transport system ATP-binding protein
LIKFKQKMPNNIVSFSDATINQRGKTVLKNVSIDVSEGGFVFLIGRTGSGKSSLIKTIYGDLELVGGVGNVAGYDLTRLKSKQIPNLRRELGVVFQDFKLLPDRTIDDNLKFVLKSTGWKNKKEITDRIDKVLKMVGITLNKNKYPFELSGGEQQRVAIARALLNEPKLIIADEPTGNLDPQTSQEIMQLFKSLHEKGMTLLMATHDYQMIVKFPGKIFKCENGKVFEVIAKT